jgi:hypothetical protein
MLNFWILKCRPVYLFIQKVEEIFKCILQIVFILNTMQMIKVLNCTRNSELPALYLAVSVNFRAIEMATDMMYCDDNYEHMDHTLN